MLYSSITGYSRLHLVIFLYLILLIWQSLEGRWLLGQRAREEREMGAETGGGAAIIFVLNNVACFIVSHLFERLGFSLFAGFIPPSCSRLFFLPFNMAHSCSIDPWTFLDFEFWALRVQVFDAFHWVAEDPVSRWRGNTILWNSPIHTNPMRAGVENGHFWNMLPSTEESFYPIMKRNTPVKRKITLRFETDLYLLGAPLVYQGERHSLQGTVMYSCLSW